MTKHLIPPGIDAYAEQYSTPESPVLAKLNRETHMKVDKAIMLSGHLQGTMLQMISHMVHPVNVLEIGTYTGYSAICLAQGLKEGGKLHTIDIDEELQDMRDRYYKEAGLQDKIVQHIGNADEVISGLTMQFDLVFIDADKVNYGMYYDMVFDKVPIGGYLLADNVLYEGDVILPEEQQRSNGKAMHLFNKKIKADTRIEHVLLPIRDGVMLIRKISN